MSEGYLEHLLSKVEVDLRKSLANANPASKHDPVLSERLEREHATLDWVENLRRAMRENDVEEAIFSGIALGARLTSFDLWDVIISSRKSSEALTRARLLSAEVRCRQTAERNASLIEMAKQVWSVNPMLTASECAEKIRMRQSNKSSTSTIRHIIGRYKPRRDRNLAGSA